MTIGTPLIQQITASTNADTKVNEVNTAFFPAALYGYNAQTTTGLTFGYYGGVFGTTDIANGTVALTGSTTNYIVANKSTGVVSSSTSTTNWLDTANYLKLYLAPTGASTITLTTTKDYRQQLGDGAGTGIPLAQKDASNGVPGLTGNKINLKNDAGTFTNFLRSLSTAARTHLFPDRSGTVADDTDLALKANLAGAAFTGNLSVDVNTSGDALRIAQAGVGAVLRLEDTATTDASPTLWDFSGLQIVGYTASISTIAYEGTSVSAKYQQNGTTIGSSSFALNAWTGTSASSGSFIFSRSRSSAVGTHTACINGNDLGAISWNGSDGTGFIQAVTMLAEVDGTPATGIMPGKLTISTENTSGVLTEAMRITSGQIVSIGGAPANTVDKLQVTGSALVSGPLGYGIYTLATLPSAAAFTNYDITVTDATGGRKACKSDGSFWKILNTTTTVS